MKILIIVQVLIMVCFLVHATPLTADQADRAMKAALPSDSGGTAAFSRSRDMEIEQAFKELGRKDFVVNRPLMDQAVLAAFGHRTREAVELACQYVRLPIVENVEGKIFSRAKEFHVAKSILQAFPDEALERLRELHDSTRDAVTRGNIVLALGGMEDDPRMWKLLLEAMDDKEVYGGDDPDALGLPLRVCDLAYNQIVAQYGIRGVLRTIGNGHAIQVRDYHINRLMKLISD